MTIEFQALIVERDSLAATNLAAFMQAARDGRVPVSEPVFGNVRDAIIKRAVRRHRIQESRLLWRRNLNDGLATGLAGVVASKRA